MRLQSGAGIFSELVNSWKFLSIRAKYGRFDFVALSGWNCSIMHRSQPRTSMKTSDLAGLLGKQCKGRDRDLRFLRQFEKTVENLKNALFSPFWRFVGIWCYCWIACWVFYRNMGSCCRGTACYSINIEKCQYLLIFVKITLKWFWSAFSLPCIM